MWKIILGKDDRHSLFSQLNAVEHTFCRDVLSQRPLPSAFHDTKSIFIHIPKCAGTSIGHALYPDASVGHRPVKWYQDRFPDEYSHYFTYSFTRNPWDRLASAWFYLKNRTGNKRDGGWADFLGQYDDFNVFVTEWLCSENVSKQLHFAPQYLYLVDKFGAVSLDYVGKIENIQADFQSVAQHLKSNAILPKLNQSKNKDYRTLYNDRSVERVAEIYKRDIQLFDYCFAG